MSAARPSTKPPPPRPPILVAGLARAGSAALDALLQDYGPADLYGWDATPSADVRHRAGLWRAKGLSIALGGDGLDSLSLIGPHGTIIKSPGIERGISLLTRAHAVGVTIIDDYGH
ncbi:MAG: hypothetical protein ABL907_22695, partial [Hyphomicrobium sp.]